MGPLALCSPAALVVHRARGEWAEGGVRGVGGGVGCGVFLGAR